MKVKTSITLSKELLKEIDAIIATSGNRSVFIEEAVRAYLNAQKRHIRDNNDLEMINRTADELNNEARDVLSYQVKL